MNVNAFCSWSGGKDSALALYRALKLKINVLYLLNMCDEKGNFSRSHGLHYSVLKRQAYAIGIPLIQKSCSWNNYEKKFKEVVLEIKKSNINAGIFGDIDLQEHRDWIEKVCKDLNIQPIIPLWKEEREKLMKEFINAKFKAIVVAVNNNLGDEWLGREIDEKFIEDIKKFNAEKNLNIDLCGERGEYHTFVYDGPIFKERVNFSIGKKFSKENKKFIEIR